MDGSVIFFFGGTLSVLIFAIWKTQQGIRAMRPQNQLSEFEVKAKKQGLRVFEDKGNSHIYAFAIVPEGTSNDRIIMTVTTEHPIKLMFKKVRLGLVVIISILVAVLYSCAPG